MIKRLDDITLTAGRPESDLLQKIKRQTGGKAPAWMQILKKSLDARDKNNPLWRYSVAYSLTPYTPPQPVYEKTKVSPKIAVIGGGPAGLFCAVRLIEHGFTPVVIERGEAVEERAQTCNAFFAGKPLNTNSNVQFGEGGAGAFSDGKLNTQTKDGYNRDVLQIFARFGAPEEILYLNKPHVGSDNLYTVLQNLRAWVVAHGGSYLFNTQFIDFTAKDNKITSLLLQNVKTDEQSQMPVDYAVCALGHSARDTFVMLHQKGVQMQAKEFAIGVRIEHLSQKISQAQYGSKYTLLPTADYKLVSHAHERAVFTFCMCPGGVVMPAASEEGGLAVNGMSLYARNGINSNSALMVQMRQSDFGEGLFGGMELQRKIEQKAYACSKSYRAPVQTFGDFANGKVSGRFGEITPTYAAGTAFADLNEVLPQTVSQALKAAIPDMGKRLKGFDCPDALLTGVETRFSSPVKIVRNENMQSVSFCNLYPCGEGSGYSGGITSSAADGLRVAENIFQIVNKFI